MINSLMGSTLRRVEVGPDAVDVALVETLKGITLGLTIAQQSAHNAAIAPPPPSWTDRSPINPPLPLGIRAAFCVGPVVVRPAHVVGPVARRAVARRFPRASLATS